ncbi:hypothetical protein VP01_344g6 [Puccinia sorghi]|uniref:Uncharacterized protein n=1 Tax=Puccinia sorghi TaxID=27349 RepID=A0A0L6UX17_9BASI|nr:hypothetical protein VP01_344g6 [Puccinia sorghi]
MFDIFCVYDLKVGGIRQMTNKFPSMYSLSQKESGMSTGTGTFGCQDVILTPWVIWNSILSEATILIFFATHNSLKSLIISHDMILFYCVDSFSKEKQKKPHLIAVVADKEGGSKKSVSVMIPLRKGIRDHPANMKPPSYIFLLENTQTSTFSCISYSFHVLPTFFYIILFFFTFWVREHSMSAKFAQICIYIGNNPSIFEVLWPAILISLSTLLGTNPIFIILKMSTEIQKKVKEKYYFEFWNVFIIIKGKTQRGLQEAGVEQGFLSAIIPAGVIFAQKDQGNGMEGWKGLCEEKRKGITHLDKLIRLDTGWAKGEGRGSLLSLFWSFWDKLMNLSNVLNSLVAVLCHVVCHLLWLATSCEYLHWVAFLLAWFSIIRLFHHPKRGGNACMLP